MRFDCIFFDSGGTLFDLAGSEDPSFKQVVGMRVKRVHALLSAFGADVDFPVLEAVVLRLEDECLRRFGESYNFLRLMVATLDDLDLRMGPEVAACLADAYAGPRYESWLFPDTKDLMHNLEDADLYLGIIANTPWPGFSMDRALAGVGLLSFFQTRVYSGDVGVAKPDVRIFRIAERMSGMQGRRILYVGDNLRADIQGASSAGWFTALRRSSRASSDGLADFEYDETLELLDFVSDD